MGRGPANTVTGSILVKASISGDFDNAPLDVDSDWLTKFAQSILGPNPINLNIIPGSYTPNNDTHVLFTDAVPGYKPRLIMLFMNRPALIGMQVRDSVNGNINRCSMPLETCFIVRPNLQESGADINAITFDGRTGIPFAMDQTKACKYQLVFVEDDGLSEA